MSRSCHSRVPLPFVCFHHPQCLRLSVTSGCPLVSVHPPAEPLPVTSFHPIMSSITSQDTTSTISHSNSSTHEEDWDRSESDIQLDGDPRTPRNSVLFPAGKTPDSSPRKDSRRGDRTLSELLKHYAEKGTDCQFSQEEATRIADVLGQWVCSLLSPLALLVSAEQLNRRPLLPDKFGFLPLRGRR